MFRLFKPIILFTLFILFCLSDIYAINPPNKGRFPVGFWRDLAHIKYGDPGWVKKMQNRRYLRQEIALKKVSGQSLAADNFIIPVLLGQFSDSAGIYTAQNFQDLLFDNNPTGTLTDYYNEVSYNQFNITGSTYGWFTADQGRAYYAGSDNGKGSNYPQNAHGFVRDIAGKSDPTVDFSQFDNDGSDGVPNSGDDDGYVDGLIVVYAGAGPDWSPSNDNLWPLMSSLGINEFETNDVSANGGNIKVNTFAVCPELSGGGAGNGQIRTIGVYAHEFGHILGLPDLYDRTDAGEGPDFEDSEGIGEWCLMATGSWGGDGAHSEKPSHLSAWCKIQMGWITPTLLTQNSSLLNIQQAETNAVAFMVWEDGYRWSRYFLVENRQKVGFDQYLNGSGLLIFHVDENRRWGKSRWSSGPVNNDETHKLVDLEEADGNADMDNVTNRGDAGDSYPGSSNNRTFSAISTPNSRDYDGLVTGVEIKNISNSGPVMTADVVVRTFLGYALSYDENGISGWSYGGATPMDTWSGVLFTTTKAGKLVALDIGFLNSNSAYEIKIYDNFESFQPNGLLKTISGSVSTIGWHTITITGDSISLDANQEFFVSLKIADKARAQSIDRWGVSTGRSYYSSDGITFQTIAEDINTRARIYSPEIGTYVAEQSSGNLTDFNLAQNYPNPFSTGTRSTFGGNQSTLISYLLPQKSSVVIKIFNLLGEEMITLVNEEKNGGFYKVVWNGKDKNGNFVPSGVYLYHLNAGSYDQMRKLMVIR